MKKGFSLVELLVVITIIAILSVAAYSAVGGNTVKARDAKRKQDITTIQQALEMYSNDFGTYPTSLESGTTAGKIPKKYLSSIPTDPGAGKKPYVYVKTGSYYNIAATLENEGSPTNFQAYVTGNSDTNLSAAAGIGYYLETGGSTFAACTAGTSILDGTKAVAGDSSKCIPYDPR
jgi:prepilin-type N-terminal cleavage/methylation domain-containing protein